MTRKVWLWFVKKGGAGTVPTMSRRAAVVSSLPDADMKTARGVVGEERDADSKKT
mgnify:CR=1 FL=1